MSQGRSYAPFPEGQGDSARPSKGTGKRIRPNTPGVRARLMLSDWDAFALLLLGLMLLIGGVTGTQKAALQPYQPHADGTEYHATIDDTGIATASSTSRTELKWEIFSRVIRGSNVVALVCKSVMYAYPKRAFSDEQWAEFMEQIEKRVVSK